MGQSYKIFSIYFLYINRKEGGDFMPAKINLLNQQFGKLKVVEETSKRKNKSVVWKCQCDCGNIVEYSTKELRSDGIIQCPNCGCNREPITHRRKDMTMEVVNNIIFLSRIEGTYNGSPKWKCQCFCGKEFEAYQSDIISGHTTSCGCLKRKYNIGDIVNNRKILEITEHTNNNRSIYYKCKCLFCQREYEATAQTLDKTFSCGCQHSIGEFNIIVLLNKNNIRYQKEYVFPKTSFRFDFAIFDENNNLIRLIEFDGEQHYKENIKNSGWNTYEKYKYTLKNDMAKNQLAKENNIPLVRIPYWERDTLNLDLLLGDKYLIKD